jgi:hypothetical protein
MPRSLAPRQIPLPVPQAPGSPAANLPAPLNLRTRLALNSAPSLVVCQRKHSRKPFPGKKASILARLPAPAVFSGHPLHRALASVRIFLGQTLPKELVSIPTASPRPSLRHSFRSKHQHNNYRQYHSYPQYKSCHQHRHQCRQHPPTRGPYRPMCPAITNNQTQPPPASPSGHSLPKAATPSASRP